MVAAPAASNQGNQKGNQGNAFDNRLHFGNHPRIAAVWQRAKNNIAISSGLAQKQRSQSCLGFQEAGSHSKTNKNAFGANMPSLPLNFLAIIAINWHHGALRKLKVLLAEDDPNDVLLVTRAIQDLRLSWDLQVVENGQQAIEYLLNAKTLDLPQGIITDIKMPLKTGLELLRELALYQQFASIPTATLTSSLVSADFEQAMEEADGYYIKSAQLKDTLQEIDELFRSFLK